MISQQGIDVLKLRTVGVKSMSPVDIELLFVISYNITPLRLNINIFL